MASSRSLMLGKIFVDAETVADLGFQICKTLEAA
jgi:hypothetical protein